MDLTRLRAMLRHGGATRILVKVLADNDNSKNQIYLGPDFTALNVLPAGNIAPDARNRDILKAALRFSWLADEGTLSPAPSAQLILYPQYPEVRMSGFLKGCRNAPSTLMTVRQAGRILFLGITSAGGIIGYITGPNSALAMEFASLRDLSRTGVFTELPIQRTDPRVQLLRELRRIHLLGWIDSKRLLPEGGQTDCTAPQCGGYTLEAELGIAPNGYAEPDYFGWEVKQHSVTDFSRPEGSHAITLMTPEPTGGFYKTGGVEAFVRKFGYPDRTRPDRINFGGRHFAGVACASTSLTMRLPGFDIVGSRLVDPSAGLVLLAPGGREAAVWSYSSLMSLWNRKHAHAVYVPSMKRENPRKQYSYGNIVRLGDGTDFLHLLKALAAGKVYYDPGIKIERASTQRPAVKRRSQFRIASKELVALYACMSKEVLAP